MHDLAVDALGLLDGWVPILWVLSRDRAPFAPWLQEKSCVCCRAPSKGEVSRLALQDVEGVAKQTQESRIHMELAGVKAQRGRLQQGKRGGETPKLLHGLKAKTLSDSLSHFQVWEDLHGPDLLLQLLLCLECRPNVQDLLKLFLPTRPTRSSELFCSKKWGLRLFLPWEARGMKFDATAAHAAKKQRLCRITLRVVVEFHVRSALLHTP